VHCAHKPKYVGHCLLQLISVHCHWVRCGLGGVLAAARASCAGHGSCQCSSAPGSPTCVDTAASLAPRREEVPKQAKQTTCCAHLAKVPHLPMSPTSKPRQTSGTRVRHLFPNLSRATLPEKNSRAEHCPCYAIAPNLRNRRRSNRHLVGLNKSRSLAPTVPSTPVTRAPLAPPAALGGGASRPTSSVAVSEHGHGHRPFQTELKPVRQLRARARDLGTETSCVRSLC